MHAYLLPFGDLKLENLDRHSNEDPDLRLFNYALPLVLPSNYAGFIIPPEFTTPETFAWLRAEAATPFYQTRATLRSLAVVCAFWLLFGSWYLGRLRQRYHAWVEVCLPGTQRGTSRRLGFREFLSGELESIDRDDIARAVERHHGVLAGRRQQDEKQNLTDELQSLRDAVELTGPQRTQLDRARSEGSLEELQKLVGVYGSLIDQRKARLAAQAQQERDRQREIQRLEVELETIPVEKRDTDARQAWDLYQQARAIEDERERLHALKEARKNVPRDLRPDRF